MLNEANHSVGRDSSTDISKNPILRWKTSYTVMTTRRLLCRSKCPPASLVLFEVLAFSVLGGERKRLVRNSNSESKPTMTGILSLPSELLNAIIQTVSYLCQSRLAVSVIFRSAPQKNVVVFARRARF
jgi:hypothetical protein